MSPRFFRSEKYGEKVNRITAGKEQGDGLPEIGPVKGASSRLKVSPEATLHFLSLERLPEIVEEVAALKLLQPALLFPD